MSVLNYPGPHQLRFYYTTASATWAPMVHVQKLNVQLVPPYPFPGDAFSTITVDCGVGADQALDVICDNYVALVDGMYSNAANNTWDYVELWNYEPLSFNASFVSVYTIAQPGISVTPFVPAGEVIVTFRTLEGGIMKLHYMESIIGGAIRDTAPFANADLEAVRAFVADTPRPFLGADTSYPFSAIAAYPGSNEALFKKRFRA